MNNLVKAMRQKNSQKRLIRLVNNEKTIHDAIKGSMEKRMKLLYSK